MESSTIAVFAAVSLTRASGPAACRIAATTASNSSSFERHATAPAREQGLALARVGRRGEADHGGAGRGGEHGARRLDAVEPGQPVVHEARRRDAAARRSPAARVAVGDRADDLDVVAQPEHELERVAIDVVVLDHHDADRRGHGRTLAYSAASRSVEVRLAAGLDVELDVRMLRR